MDPSALPTRHPNSAIVYDPPYRWGTNRRVVVPLLFIISGHHLKNTLISPRNATWVSVGNSNEDAFDAPRWNRRDEGKCGAKQAFNWTLGAAKEKKMILGRGEGTGSISEKRQRQSRLLPGILDGLHPPVVWVPFFPQSSLRSSYGWPNRLDPWDSSLPLPIHRN